MNRFDSKMMWVVSCLGLVACDYSVQGGNGGGGSAGGGSGGTSTAVTLSGHTLEPKSAFALEIPAGGMIPPGAVYAVLSSVSNLCDGIGGCAVSTPVLPNGTHLTLLFGREVGRTYTVAGMDASAEFSHRESGSTFKEQATSGSVTVTGFSAPGTVRARYTLVFTGGGTISGELSTTYCEGFSLNVPFGGVKCTGGALPSPGNDRRCEMTCSCQQKQVTAKCVSTDAGHSCTCTQANGAESMCTMGTVSGNSNACEPYLTCCPLF